MARSFARLQSSTWAPGSDFRELSPQGQWAYMLLISQPQVSNLGVLPYTPEKWARLAAGVEVAALEAAIEELAAKWFVIVDRSAGELLIRTFIRHDKVYAQPALVTNARVLIGQVESDEIRAYLTSRHPWLIDGRDKQAIVAYEESGDHPPETPPESPLDRSLSENGVDRRGKGKGVRGGVAAAEDQETQALHVAQPAAVALAEREEPERPAAASESEPVSLERAVQSLALLSGWDSGSLVQIEPLLQQVPDVWFAKALQTTLQRRNVRNQVGLFRHLLQTAINDWRKAQHETRLATWDALFGEAGIERVKRDDPERYVLAWATPQADQIRPLPASAVVGHVFDYVHDYVDDDQERTRLLELFVQTVERPPTFNDLNGWVLFQIDRAQRPLADVEAVLRTAVADERERERLLAFAHEIHSNIEQERSNVA